MKTIGINFIAVIGACVFSVVSEASDPFDSHSAWQQRITSEVQTIQREIEERKSIAREINNLLSYYNANDEDELRDILSKQKNTSQDSPEDLAKIESQLNICKEPKCFVLLKNKVLNYIISDLETLKQRPGNGSSNSLFNVEEEIKKIRHQYLEPNPFSTTF